MPDFTPSSHPAIIDIEKTFRSAIAKYSLLDQAASSLTTDLASLSPQQIFLRSKQLAKMQHDMANQDDQLIAIMALAGQEIVNESFINDYRQIIVKVILNCDRIEKQASLVRKNLVNGSTIHRNLDSSCQD